MGFRAGKFRSDTSVRFDSRGPIRGPSDSDSVSFSEFELPSSLLVLSQAISSENRDLTTTENQALRFGGECAAIQGFGTVLAQ